MKYILKEKNRDYYYTGTMNAHCIVVMVCLSPNIKDAIKFKTKEDAEKEIKRVERDFEIIEVK